MAEPYLTRLREIVDRLRLPTFCGVPPEPKHFFSGAALYAGGKIFASLSPAGFAMKLPPDTRKRLIEEGRGAEFRFFASGPVKREYVALSESTVADDELFRELIELGIGYAPGAAGLKGATAK